MRALRKLLCFGVFQVFTFAFAVIFSSSAVVTTRLSRLDKEVVDTLVKQWAPVVWLAPGEKFMPLDVDEFLYHVHAESGESLRNKKNSKMKKEYLNPKAKWNSKLSKELLKDSYKIPGLPVGEASEKSYLVTNSEVDDLLTDPNSFLYGKSPTNTPVSIYAVVKICNVPAEYPEEVIYDTTPPIHPLIRLTSVTKEATNKNAEIASLHQKQRIKRNTSFVQAANAFNASDPNAPQTNEITKEASEFMANMADNVKFTPDKMEKEQFTRSKEKNVPQFHVTYWMFYPYSQGKAMCTLSLGPLGRLPIPMIFGMCLGSSKDFGSHVGDWEHMSLYFTGGYEPEYMYVSAHDAGAYYSYNRLTGTFEFKSQETRKGILQRPNFPKTVTTSQNHPVLFAAQGSHGLWTAPGKHRFVRVARLYDINGFGTPWYTWKSIQISYENLRSQRSMTPNWFRFKGKWGNPKSKCHPFRRIGINFCEYSDGPTGIPLKQAHFHCNAPVHL